MGIKFEDVLNSTTIADDIAVESMVWHYRFMKEEMEDFETNDNTKVHIEDYQYYISASSAFEEVLKYYGR